MKNYFVFMVLPVCPILMYVCVQSSQLYTVHHTCVAALTSIGCVVTRLLLSRILSIIRFPPLSSLSMSLVVTSGWGGLECEHSTWYYSSNDNTVHTYVDTILYTMLMIMANHQTFPRQFKHLTGQNKFV